jgi:HK97 family phage portal protein
MQFFGFTIMRTKALPQLQSVESRNTWWPIIREPYTGAFQRNDDESADNILRFSAVYACVTLIASDIGKMRLRLVQQDDKGFWSETESPAFSPVLRKPNRYQTRVKFVEWWITSKLVHGNTYVLKQRDNRGIVTALYILDPTRTRPLVAPDGSVFYELRRDNLSGLQEEAPIVPASEIIHDKMDPLFHPLVGTSPLYACSLAALLGLNIQDQSQAFFAGGSKPGGVLTAPGSISADTAERLSEKWATNFSGDNIGRIAVLGDGLKYEAMTVRATDAQLIEQLKWTAEDVARAFHVPPYMIGVGDPPNFNNIEALNQQYYSQCLQTLVEEFEAELDQGLELPKPYGTEFDVDDLLRMDTSTRVTAVQTAIRSGAVSPNEARKKWLDLPPVPGGDTPYMQEQDHSLQALAERDEKPIAALPPAREDEDDMEMERAAQLRADVMRVKLFTDLGLHVA